METFAALLALCAGNSPVPVNSPHNGQWRGALMFSLICVWINGWINNREAGDLRRHRVYYDVTVMNDSLTKTTVAVRAWMCTYFPLFGVDVITYIHFSKSLHRLTYSSIQWTQRNISQRKRVTESDRNKRWRMYSYKMSHIDDCVNSCGLGDA